MAFDFKKEYKEFYMPKNKPSILTVPAMNYIAVRGHGDPNQEDGEYKQAIGLLYGIAFTIKMSKKGDHQIKGYFDYVVPPLEGFWWQDGILGVDYAHKEDFNWISVIRLPDFVTKADFDWAVEEAAKKARADAFIRTLPGGYDFVLQEGASNIAQGQRQLLAIARAAVADPPVLILDEATSSIDTRTERLIEKGMDKLMEGRTVFVIAHRLSTVKNCDVIMVLDHGKIIERGNHDKLIAEKGTYYRLYTGAFELE